MPMPTMPAAARKRYVVIMRWYYSRFFYLDNSWYCNIAMDLARGRELIKFCETKACTDVAQNQKKTLPSWVFCAANSASSLLAGSRRVSRMFDCDLLCSRAHRPYISSARGQRGPYPVPSARDGGEVRPLDPTNFGMIAAQLAIWGQPR